MARLRYKFNAETLLFEATRTSNRKKTIRILTGFVISLVLAVGYYTIFSQYFDTPKSRALQRDNASILAKYDLLNKQFQPVGTYLNHLQRRENNVYRTTFGMDTILSTFRSPGFGGVSRYPKEIEGTEYETMLAKTFIQLEILKRRTAIQSKSFDTIEKMAARTELMKECIPAIQPTIPDAVRLTDVFRWRTDPIYGDVRKHSGMDFAGSVGTPVFATGNGVVTKVENTFFGYGKYIMVNHGFGYETRYAHLHTMTVAVGQEVKRGEQIGTLGNTGKSTGPHLHYEVRYLGNPIDPMKYYSSDIEVEEYERILQTAQDKNNEY